MNLADKVVVVTGASRGLGRAFAEALVEEGAFVFGLARSEDHLRAVKDALGASFCPVSCDVTDPEAVDAAFGTIRAEKGRIDVLINNAGLGRFEAIENVSLNDWTAQLDTNLTGVFLCTQAAVPFMKAQNEENGFGGHIVNIASIAGLVGNPTLSAYNATKFGLRGFSEALMKELRHDGIKVSCLYPGSVQTGFSGGEEGDEVKPHKMQTEDLAATVLHVLQTADHYLISEVVMRPLRPRR